MLIVGLGNPGEKYTWTRHNAGFLVLDRIAERLGGTWKKKANLEADIVELNDNGKKIILAKPQTFMNNSGVSVRKLLDAYSIQPEQLVVVYDDFTLNFGEINIRSTASGGSHNGIKSILEHVESVFTRVRFGIGATPERREASDWVLSNFSKTEKDQLPELIDQATDMIL